MGFLEADQPQMRGGYSLATLASASLALLLVLALATPIYEMSGLFRDRERLLKFSGYGALLVIHLASWRLRGLQRSVGILTTPVAAALVWYGASLGWAQDVNTACRRLCLLSLVYSCIFTSISDLGYRRSLRMVRIILGLALALNWISVFALPGVSRQSSEGYELWRGMMAHKNIAGILCGMTILVYAIDARGSAASIRLPVILGASIFLLKTWSRTALASICLATLFAILLSYPNVTSIICSRRGRKTLSFISWFAPGIVLCAIAALTVERDLLLSFTDDSAALSFRNSIWRPLIQYYLDNPVFGSGYGAYWSSSADADAFSTQRWLRNVDQAHNGYLDILVQCGFPGLALALYAAWTWPIRQLASMLEGDAERTRLTFSLLFFLMVENLSESSLLMDDALGNVFILFSLAQVCRYSHRYDRRAARKFKPQIKM